MNEQDFAYWVRGYFEVMEYSELEHDYESLARILESHVRYAGYTVGKDGEPSDLLEDIFYLLEDIEEIGAESFCDFVDLRVQRHFKEVIDPAYAHDFEEAMKLHNGHLDVKSDGPPTSGDPFNPKFIRRNSPRRDMLLRC